MLLLHISDIHFRTPDCLNPDLDPEKPIRTMMVRDARNRRQILGDVDAILVGGDIAFKGEKILTCQYHLLSGPIGIFVND